MKTVRRRILELALGGLTLALVPSSVVKAEEPPVFSGSTEVISVEVPLQVTVSGVPARGLKAEDFAVYEGRKRLRIAGFEAVDLAAGESVLVPLPAAARRHFLFLFDLGFTEPKAILKARTAARDLLSSLYPSDLVAVATYRAALGPQLVLGFTSDRKQVATALESLGLPELLDRSPDPLRLAVGTIKKVLNAPSAPRVMPQTEPEGFDRELLDALESAEGESTRTDRAVDQGRISAFTYSLSTFARLLGEVEGRKYLVLFSEGFDTSLIAGTSDLAKQEELQQSVLSGESWRVDSELRFGTTEAGNEIERMLESLRRADCVVQAVDVAGLRSQDEEREPRRGDRDSLLWMARATGGELYESFNDLSQALQRMNTRTSYSYVLSVEPEPLAADGAYHKLRVELKAPLRGAQLTARQGFYAPKPYAERDPLERLLQTANMVMSGEESEDIDLAVLAIPTRSGREKSYVSLMLEAAGATLLRGKQPPSLPIEIYAYALDGSGAVHDFVSETLRFDLGKAEPVLRRGGLKFVAHLELLPGDFSLRVLVRNGATGLYGLRVLPLHVPPFGETTAELLPPLFADPGNRWLLAHEEPRGEQLEPPFPDTPAARPELLAGGAVRFVVAGYGLGKGPWKGSAELLKADGARAGVARLQLTKPMIDASGPDRSLATLVVPDLPAGRYDLRLTWTGSDGTSRGSTVPITLRGAKRGNTPP